MSPSMIFRSRRKKESCLFYEEDVTLGNVENVRIDVEEPEDGSQNGEE